MVLFSVIIPTYNRACLVGKTIDSILNQTFKDYEIIVVDDRSTDNTHEVLKPYIENHSIRYFLNAQNSERAVSRNRGIDEAKGKYISLLDSDDILFPDCLMAASEFLSHHPDCSFCHVKYVLINENYEVVKKQDYPESDNAFKEIMKGNYVSNIGFFLLGDTARKLRVDENPVFRGVEDYDFIIRAIAECGGIKTIDRYECGVLMHPQRSVFTDDWDFLCRRTVAFMEKQLKADYFRKHYWPYRYVFVSHLCLYLSSSLAIRKKTGKAIYYLVKAFANEPPLLFTRAFWRHAFVIVKFWLKR